MIKMIIITGIILVSAQVSAIEHKPNPIKNQKVLVTKKTDKGHKSKSKVKAAPKVSVLNFDKKVAKKKPAKLASKKLGDKKVKKLSMKAMDRKLKRQAKFTSTPCKDGYISNNKAYCAVKAQPKALAKLSLKLDKKVKPQRMVASQKDLESKRKK